jgi:hypothetical protein
MELNSLFTNYTPCVVEPGLTTDRHGADVFLLVAKMTWQIMGDGSARYAVPQRGVRMLDEKVDDDNPFSSVLYPGDYVDHKPGTDVIMVAKAYPEEGAKSHDVTLRIARRDSLLEKTVRVFGTRVYMKGPRGITPGPAAAPAVTPLQYELAHGGTEIEGDEFARSDVNPAGVGVAINPKKLVGAVAHQLEIVGGSEPAGFGALGPGWQPRIGYAGTLDAKWQKTRHPFLPEDFDPRFNCVAHPDLYCEEPLTGTEPVEIVGATPDGPLRFQLPEYAPAFESLVDDVERDLDPHLDTFLIDVENRLVELTWRATQRIPRKIKRLKQVIVRPGIELPEALVDQAARDLHKYQVANYS